MTTRPVAARSTRPAGAPGSALALLLLLCALALPPGCVRDAAAEALFLKARGMWQSGQYVDAARNFITLTEIYPHDPRVEESLYWAASLYQFYLETPAEAARHYARLVKDFPEGPFFLEAQENLALLFEDIPEERFQAVQVYRELLSAPARSARRDYFLVKLARVYMAMGRMDQARFELRRLIRDLPDSGLKDRAYYLVGYSYFLEQRYPMAMVAFNQVVKDFPGTPVAVQSQFFMADTLEEQGQLRRALRLFEALKDTYHNPKIIEKRIASLRTRMRSSVR